MISPEMLESLVCHMRQYGITTFEQQADGSRLFVALSPVSSQDTPVSTPEFSNPAPKELITLHSPELGTFRNGPFQIGDTVNAGDIVAFTDVGPLRLPIVSQERGVIVEIAISDGQTVGYHTPVMHFQSDYLFPLVVA